MAMASNPILVPFLLSFMLLVLANEATAKNVIELGSSLSPDGNQSSWVSSSGHFAFGFYPHGDGYAVGIWLVGATESKNTVVWTANRDDQPIPSNYTLQLTINGLLLKQGIIDQGDLYQGKLYVASEPARSASMLDSGNFVIYGQEGAYIVWQSFHYPTDTILAGQNLTIGNKLVSSLSKSDHSSGRFYLIMQTDNNLFAYTMHSASLPEDAYWYHVATSAPVPDRG